MSAREELLARLILSLSMMILAVVMLSIFKSDESIKLGAITLLTNVTTYWFARNKNEGGNNGGTPAREVGTNPVS